VIARVFGVFYGFLNSPQVIQQIEINATIWAAYTCFISIVRSSFSRLPAVMMRPFALPCDGMIRLE